jgi:hypothetical protein
LVVLSTELVLDLLVVVLERLVKGYSGWLIRLLLVQLGLLLPLVPEVIEVVLWGRLLVILLLCLKMFPLYLDQRLLGRYVLLLQLLRLGIIGEGL